VVSFAYCSAAYFLQVRHCSASTTAVWISVPLCHIVSMPLLPLCDCCLQVRLAVFSQHHVDGLDLALSPLQIMLNSYAGLKDQEARQHLGSFGVSGPLALQPMYTLSGGQKSRVALAKVGGLLGSISGYVGGVQVGVYSHCTP
jgi:hypothetical protein